MKIGQMRQQVTLESYSFRMLAALCSVSAGAIHLALAPEHFGEWWGYGWFFVVVASFQVLYGMGLLVPKSPFFTLRWYLLAGVMGTLFVMLVYTASRTLGVPFLGPHAGHVESVSMSDLLSQALELGLVGSLTVLLFQQETAQWSHRVRTALALLFGGFAVVALLLAIAGLSGGRFSADAHDEALLEALPVAPVQTLPAARDLLPLLGRSGYGPRETDADVAYLPPTFFQVLGEKAPAASLERPTLVFRLVEADHEHRFGLTPEPPPARLSVDGEDAVEPYQVDVLMTDGEAHRTVDYLFPMPGGMSQETLSQEKHTVTLTFPLEKPEGESVFKWKLPLELPGAAPSASVPAAPAGLQASVLRPLLTQSRTGVAYGGRKDIHLEATYATPEYVAAALPEDAASLYLPDQFTLFLLSEILHDGDLPASLPEVILSLDGRKYSPDLVKEVTTSPHHRLTLVRFPAKPPAGPLHRVMELELPGDAVMTWHLPISYAGHESRPGGGFSWIWVLALLGGLVASMWPCLFQLTVFFIPALGGLSMQEASSGSVSLRRRASVVKAALFFVLGFTVVYTVAGALIGLVAGRVGDLTGFYTWQRYLSIGGGIVIVLMALRVAAQVRAPLVCKMPVLSRMSHRNRPANPFEMMAAGVAFATGCMTCFGAAMVMAMVMYVGLTGSPLVGAFTLFLFSVGMGVPLVIAATAMAKVLPLLSRFERAVRWTGFASSLVMAGFAVLLITGNYMALTEWVYGAVAGLSSH
ncbi:MAG: cytochrome c biogenesis protein CcdA [Chloroflexi bacterium]|nr:cytochrome c biogenesis protein CcdA [Chloroflexota bacterium]